MANKCFRVYVYLRPKAGVMVCWLSAKRTMPKRQISRMQKYSM